MRYQVEEGVFTDIELATLRKEWQLAGGKTPVIGLTGTGGAGKSSVTDELLNRFLASFPDMRIAVISDIHGNLVALEAVLADIAKRGADQIINCGDLCNAPLWPRETFDLLETLKLPTVRGNHDRWAVEPDRASSSGPDGDRDLGAGARELSPATRGFLAELPPRWRATIDGVRLCLLYQSPNTRDSNRHRMPLAA